MDNRHGDAAMIDTADKQTAYLPLEQPKRGRGRPATGAALTAAEKQKAYRERQKAKQEELEREMHNAYATSRVDEFVNEDLFEELETAKAEAAAAVARAEQAEADFVTLRKKLDKALSTITELKKSNKECELAGIWTVQSRLAGTKKWTSAEIPETFKVAKDSVDYMQFKSGSGQGSIWRAVRDDGMVYWPKVLK